MANLGRDRTGSQFFVTLAPAPHLDAQYTIFGEAADGRSRDVLGVIAASPTDVWLDRVTISAS